MASFVGLYTGLSGVRAAQVGIDVSSHNVANSGTAGYTRQRVELAAKPSYISAYGPVGTGVTVSQIGRLRDTFLDARARGALGDHGATSVRAELLVQLEALTGEPDTGISTQLDALWTAAEAWANAPADSSARRQVLSDLAAITDTFRSVATQWDALAADTAAERDTVLAGVNDTLTALADLDRRLANAEPGRVGHELYDQRDLMLDELAHLTGASVRIGADGRASVELDGVQLLSPDGAGRVEVGADGGLQVVAPDGATTAATAGGVVGGLTRALQEDLPAWRAELDALAAGVADAVNDVNTSGVRADGSPGVALLTYDASDPAGTLAAATTDAADLAAAVSGAPPAPHDASNARRLADLRTTPYTDADGRSATLTARVTDLVVGLGSAVRASRTAADGARSIASAAGIARSAEHGVSLDEEMVNLVRYQRALEAAARVMTTVDQALDTLVNRVGIVGR